jgi:hypothetical protein
MVNDTREQTARDQAVTQLKKRRDFHAHLLIYVLVNAFLVVIWAVKGVHVFFWPIFPIAGWGIAVVMNAWDVYGRHPITEQDIRHEIEREDKRG